MAYVHTSHNDLAEKLERMQQQREERWLAEAQEDDERHQKARPIYLALGILFALVVVFFIWKHQIPTNVRIGVRDGLRNYANEHLGDPLVFGSRNFFEVILYLILDVVRPLLGAILCLLAPLLGWLAWLAMYAVPALLGCFFGTLAATDDWSGEMPGPSDEEEILRAGLEGEQAALSCLADLDNNCHVYTNMRVRYQGSESETDMIVLTPAGITIVEVKNHKGLITGDTSDHELYQNKHPDWYNSEEKEFYNPIRQVAKHAHNLAGYLRERGLRTYVRTCVLFVSDEVTLRLTDSQRVLANKCPVFTTRDLYRLHRYLENSDNRLTGSDYNRALELLENLRR